MRTGNHGEANRETPRDYRFLPPAMLHLCVLAEVIPLLTTDDDSNIYSTHIACFSDTGLVSDDCLVRPLQ